MYVTVDSAHVIPSTWNMYAHSDRRATNQPFPRTERSGRLPECGLAAFPQTQALDQKRVSQKVGLNSEPATETTSS